MCNNLKNRLMINDKHQKYHLLQDKKQPLAASEHCWSWAKLHFATLYLLSSSVGIFFGNLSESAPSGFAFANISLFILLSTLMIWAVTLVYKIRMLFYNLHLSISAAFWQHIWPIYCLLICSRLGIFRQSCSWLLEGSSVSALLCWTFQWLFCNMLLFFKNFFEWSYWEVLVEQLYYFLLL